MRDFGPVTDLIKYANRATLPINAALSLALVAACGPSIAAAPERSKGNNSSATKASETTSKAPAFATHPGRSWDKDFNYQIDYPNNCTVNPTLPTLPTGPDTFICKVNGDFRTFITVRPEAVSPMTTAEKIADRHFAGLTERWVALGAKINKSDYMVGAIPGFSITLRHPKGSGHWSLPDDRKLAKNGDVLVKSVIIRKGEQGSSNNPLNVWTFTLHTSATAEKQEVGNFDQMLNSFEAPQLRK